MNPKRLMQMADLGDGGKSVRWLNGKPMPAAFLVNMPFRFVMCWLPRIKAYKQKGGK